jgi:PIN domain nuclease of toxin-antitoxin system
VSSTDLLDASAVLAVRGGMISAVNLAEVFNKLIQRGVPKKAAVDVTHALNLQVIPFDLAEALHSADFVHPGVSLGDRACLGTARTHHLRAVTADSRWRDIRANVKVHVFRRPKT